MSEINRCPICGSEMKIEEEHPWVRLRCSGCPLDFGRYWFEDEKMLIANWNVWISADKVRNNARNFRAIPVNKDKYDKLFTRRTRT